MSQADTELKSIQTRDDADSDSVEIVEAGPGPVLSPATRGEIDVQIVTAKRYPRSIRSFKDQAMAMATLDEETAAGCFYSLPRGGKPIEGPSVRLAEIVLSAWGNVRADARVIDAGPKEITAEAMCWDLEKNVAVRVQVRRRITDKRGQRYNDDMIVVTGNAACSIALRNAVFKVIPMAYSKAIYQQARLVAVGDARTLSARRGALIDYFGKMGVRPEQIFAAVGRAGVDDITLDDLATLHGFATAIKEGDSTIEEMFSPKSIAPAANGHTLASAIESLPKGGAAADIAERINAQRAEKVLNGNTTGAPANAASPATTTPSQGEAGNAPAQQPPADDKFTESLGDFAKPDPKPEPINRPGGGKGKLGPVTNSGPRKGEPNASTVDINA